jgi:hypothetical protein
MEMKQASGVSREPSPTMEAVLSWSYGQCCRGVVTPGRRLRENFSRQCQEQTGGWRKADRWVTNIVGVCFSGDFAGILVIDELVIA